MIVQSWPVRGWGLVLLWLWRDLISAEERPRPDGMSREQSVSSCLIGQCLLERFVSCLGDASVICL